MPGLDDVFIEKALAALAGAESELAAGRYDNVANRCYYACFQAAIAALEAAGMRPSGGPDARWSHHAVQAQFGGVLINRRKRYSTHLREALSQIAVARQRADYTRDRVTERDARRVMRRSREFVEAIQTG